jgi:hypothetical protein
MVDKKRLKSKLLSKMKFTLQYPFCRVWAGTIKSNGYGVFRLDGVEYLAHRAAYIVYHGPIPEGYVIHHWCENRLCITPNHIVSLTGEQHVKLTARTGAYRGEKNRNSRHSNEKIKHIKELAKAGISARVLAEEFDIPRSTLSQILSGQSRARG